MILVNGRLKDALALATGAGKKLNAICFSCNGSVRRIGGVVSNAVLGVGTGKWAARTFEVLAKKLGEMIANNPSQCRVFVLQRPTLDYALVGVKTKEQWMLASDLNQITAALTQLVSMTDRMGWTGVVVPIFGTGSGRLAKNDVLPIMNELLDHRFICVEFDESTPSNVETF